MKNREFTEDLFTYRQEHPDYYETDELAEIENDISHTIKSHNALGSRIEDIDEEEKIGLDENETYPEYTSTPNGIVDGSDTEKPVSDTDDDNQHSQDANTDYDDEDTNEEDANDDDEEDTDEDLEEEDEDTEEDDDDKDEDEDDEEEDDEEEEEEDDAEEDEEDDAEEDEEDDAEEDDDDEIDDSDFENEDEIFENSQVAQLSSSSPTSKTASSAKTVPGNLLYSRVQSIVSTIQRFFTPGSVDMLSTRTRTAYSIGPQIRKTYTPIDTLNSRQFRKRRNFVWILSFAGVAVIILMLMFFSSTKKSNLLVPDELNTNGSITLKEITGGDSTPVLREKISSLLPDSAPSQSYETVLPAEIDPIPSRAIKQTSSIGASLASLTQDTMVAAPTTQSNNIVEYTVQPGDTLWKISQKVLGNGSRFSQIAEQNDLNDPSDIRVGMVLKIKKD